MKRVSKKKPVSRNNLFTKIGAGVGIIGVATGSLLWITFGKGKPVPVPAYHVQRVIDGDTFVTDENQYIRVASVEAPELTLCGGEEAKIALENLVLNKPLYIKVLYRDVYDRLVSLVYSKNTFVNEELVRRGFAYYLPRQDAESVQQLKVAGADAREQKLGIFSESCTQLINRVMPSCNIKGNTRNGNIYYLPDCGVYHNTTVQLYLGDRWFCTEKEAIAAGFRKPEQCK